MKQIIAAVIFLICIALCVFLVSLMDISEAFENVKDISVSACAVYDCGTPDEAHEASENIAEDPSVGVLYSPYDYSLPVPESEAVDNSYFDRCVFIGDSRMLGLVKYNDIEPINYCSVGFSVGAYDNATFVRIGDKNYTVKDALRENDDYDAVYIATGLNELGWPLKTFAEKYEYMIKDIKEAAGDRPIYIQLIMPITNSFESSKKMNPYSLKNSDVVRFNESLKAMAQKCEVYYLDCSALFTLEDGSLDPNKSSDGAHLTLSAYSDQLDYYKTHVVKPRES